MYKLIDLQYKKFNDEYIVYNINRDIIFQCNESMFLLIESIGKNLMNKSDILSKVNERFKDIYYDYREVDFLVEIENMLDNLIDLGVLESVNINEKQI